MLRPLLLNGSGSIPMFYFLYYISNNFHLCMDPPEPAMYPLGARVNPTGHGSRMPEPGNGPCIDSPYQKPVRVHGPIDRFGSRVSSPVDPWSCMLCNIDFSFFFHFPIQKRIFIRIDNRVYCSINLSISCCCF